MNTTYDLFLSALANNTLGDIASALGLHTNTIIRWRKKRFVPPHYAHDLIRILGQKLDVQQDVARDKNQFYTKPAVAKECIKVMKKECAKLEIDLSDYWFIEPSAGCGWFFDNLPQKRRIGIDIEPRAKTQNNHKLDCADYLSWEPSNLNRKYIVIGNPPFGLRGHLALRFINHSAKFADVVAFILPQLFDSDGKGAAGKRVNGYQLAYSKRLKPNSFEYPDGRDVNVSTVFQVWTKINTQKIKRNVPDTCKNFIKVYSLSDGGTPTSTRNKKMLYGCDVYLPSTCFKGMKAYRTFEELPHQRGYGVVIYPPYEQVLKNILINNDWTKTAFPSTNAALNLRCSLIESVITDNGYKDN
ncbi:MAG: hypothetical protein ACNYPH_06245 [Gammaproteobacteria bacterium WSBS_2016_MAG_OTU1]